MKFKFVLFILIIIILLLPIYSTAQISQTEVLKKELQELQEQLNETKKLYEEKILQLETKINNLEQQLQSSEPAQSTFPGMSSSTAYLPDISFIGNIVGSFGDSQDNKIYLDGGEFAFGGYIFPNARLDAILGIHRHEDHYETELEEGYISFFNLPGNFGFQAGKKLLDFGKINQMHEHHYLFVDKPLPVEAYLGEHGVIGNGVSINYLFPLPFFLQGSVGYWVLEDHKCEGEEHHRFAPTGNAFNTRLWNSFAVSDATEMEIGASYLKAKGPHHADSPEDVDDINLYGLDITLKHQGFGSRRLLFRNEFYFLQRDRFKPGEIDEEWWRKGLYSLLAYRFNQYWEAGMRYDWIESPGIEKETNQAYSIFLTRNLTETTKFRVQTSYHTEENEWRFYIQALFGIGPHSHPLE